MALFILGKISLMTKANLQLLRIFFRMGEFGSVVGFFMMSTSSCSKCPHFLCRCISCFVDESHHLTSSDSKQHCRLPSEKNMAMEKWSFLKMYLLFAIGGFKFAMLVHQRVMKGHDITVNKFTKFQGKWRIISISFA